MIRIDSIHKRFQQHAVLKGVSLDVRQGEVVCLIGPSGSGKSTVLRCINGFETYDEGTITIEKVAEAIDRYGIDADKPNPTTV